MAIARGAGTEILRTHLFSATNALQKLIIGEQHHIYTVLSIAIHCTVLNAASPEDTIGVRFTVWDNHAGGSAAEPVLFKANPQVNETFVWDNKFSFNGYEPTGASGSFGAGNAAADLAYQNAIADQGGSVAQTLEAFMQTDAAYSIVISFIDQNNA